MKNKEEFCGFYEKEYRPIIRDESAQILKSLIRENKPKQILEIGTLIGYSACLMLETYEKCFITSIEKDKENSEFAIQNLNEMGFDGRFEIKNMDALDFLKNNDKIFDFIFLDGPKGQYIKYFPYLKKFLKKGGILVADDILFYGLVSKDEKIEHKHRSIVNNMRKFLEELKTSNDFETNIYEIEDGLSVSIKLN